MPRARLAELVTERHAHIVVSDLAMVATMSPDLDAAHDAQARRVLRHDYLRHASVVGAAPAGAAHDDEEVGAKPVRGEPFVAVNHPLVAIADRRGFDRPRIR